MTDATSLLAGLVGAHALFVAVLVFRNVVTRFVGSSA